MATIITVHGTGASGPEEGERWWQKGSPFEKHIRELVESNDGALTFQPLGWDGANSEASRRKAAEKLYGQLQQLEGEDQRYTLIAHSHGGSVIENALLLAGSKSNPLPHLTRMITVGTPFIKSVRSLWLFSRVGLAGKSALVSGFAFAFILVSCELPALYSLHNLFLSRYAVGHFIIGGLVPFVMLYCLLLVMSRQRYYMYRSQIRRFSSREFAGRLIPLRHEDDEAINGLKSLKGLNIRIFRRNFAVSMLSFSALFVLPLLLLVGAWAPSFFSRFVAVIGLPSLRVDGIIKGDEPFLVRLTEVGVIIQSQATESIAALLGMSIGEAAYLVPPIALIIISMAITLPVSMVSRFVSSMLSVALDRLTWKQIRRIGFGNDTIGETSIDADSSCSWLGLVCSALPVELSREITDVSNRAASAAVVKFRGVINDLALSKENEVKEFFFAEYLTWDELIHCSYFNVPRFRMLVAYAIANSEGFRPTEAFKNHPDYDLVAGWYEEIRPKEAKGAERPA